MSLSSQWDRLWHPYNELFSDNHCFRLPHRLGPGHIPLQAEFALRSYAHLLGVIPEEDKTGSHYLFASLFVFHCLLSFIWLSSCSAHLQSKSARYHTSTIPILTMRLPYSFVDDAAGLYLPLLLSSRLAVLWVRVRLSATCSLTRHLVECNVLPLDKCSLCDPHNEAKSQPPWRASISVLHGHRPIVSWKGGVKNIGLFSSFLCQLFSRHLAISHGKLSLRFSWFSGNYLFTFSLHV